jgi:NSS family neurotransmitter:Na+ symporter
MQKEEFFTSRWGLILATLGIAVGTGNIWRFSRIVAQNGGGSFLIPWMIFLFVWSLPLIIAEFAIGKYARKGPVGAIAKIAGKKFTWMGAFIAFVSTAIMFYYSVVTGWTLRYLYTSVTGKIFETTNHLKFWNSFASGTQPLLFHFFAMLIGSFVIYKGVVKGIEKTNKFLVSALVIILIVILVRAVTLPGAVKGLNYFFTPKLEYILDYKVWLNALTQNAWDTGAGWGLILTYAVYMRKQEDIPVNAALIGFGNNSISLVAGIIIFSTVFSLSSVDAMSQITQSGPANTGLTFIYLPLLFSHLSSNITVNIIFASLFFLALSFAAISSLISLIELTTKTIIDFGFDRKKAIILVGSLGFLLGIPSALDLNIFANQDWVWGVALILSGGFIAFAIVKFGVVEFRNKLINDEYSNIKIGKWYDIIIKYLIPFQAIVLLIWWLASSISWDSEWWNPFHVANAGTCFLQWGILLLAVVLLNKKIYKQIFGNK